MKAASKATGTGAATAARGAIGTGREAIVVVSAHRLFPPFSHLSLFPLWRNAVRVVLPLSRHMCCMRHIVLSSVCLVSAISSQRDRTRDTRSGQCSVSSVQWALDMIIGNDFKYNHLS